MTRLLLGFTSKSGKACERERTGPNPTKPVAERTPPLLCTAHSVFDSNQSPRLHIAVVDTRPSSRSSSCALA